MQTWRPTHVAVAVGSGGDPAGAHLGITVKDLDDALDLGRLSVAYQPKIGTRAGSPYALEALAWWHRPDDDSVPPDDFVTLAEIAGRIERLTDVVFGRSIRWFAWHLGVVAAAALPQALGAFADRPGLIDLRRRGLGIALDDFGVGHASLLELARHPFSDLKIDRSLIRAVATTPQSRTIVEAIMGLATNLGMRVIAEGVEDAASRAGLEELGCHLMQGNYLAPAMEPPALLDWRSRRGVT